MLKPGAFVAMIQQKNDSELIDGSVFSSGLNSEGFITDDLLFRLSTVYLVTEACFSTKKPTHY